VYAYVQMHTPSKFKGSIKLLDLFRNIVPVIMFYKCTKYLFKKLPNMTDVLRDMLYEKR